MNKAFFNVEITSKRTQYNKVNININLSEYKKAPGEMLLLPSALRSLSKFNQTEIIRNLIVEGSISVGKNNQKQDTILIMASHCIKAL